MLPASSALFLISLCDLVSFEFTANISLLSASSLKLRTGLALLTFGDWVSSERRSTEALESLCPVVLCITV